MMVTDMIKVTNVIKAKKAKRVIKVTRLPKFMKVMLMSMEADHYNLIFATFFYHFS